MKPRIQERSNGRANRALNLKFSLPRAASLALLFATATAAPAATLLSTLQGDSNGFLYNISKKEHRMACDFLTGQFPTTITGTTLELYSEDPVFHTIRVSIFSDNGGVPGTLVGSFEPRLYNTFPFSTTSPGINLAPNTKYWEVMQMEEDTVLETIAWCALNGAPAPGTAFSLVGSTPVKYSIDEGVNWYNASIQESRFSLVGTQVPEPSCGLFIGAGLLGTYLMSRRRSKRT